MMRQSHLLKLFLHGELLFLIARNPQVIVRYLSTFAVYHSFTARTENIMCSWLKTTNHKRRELNCVSSANVELLRYSEANNK